MACAHKKGCYPPFPYFLADEIESSKSQRELHPRAWHRVSSSSERDMLACTSMLHTSHTGPNLLGGVVWDMVVNSKEGVSRPLSVNRSSHDLKLI